MDVPATIACAECGGLCHLLTLLDPEMPPVSGDVMTYRCEDCPERWDIVLEDGDIEDADAVE